MSCPGVGLGDKPSLKVLHISTADNAGGSGRSAYRIHSGLRKLGHQSRMLVSLRVTDDPDVAPIWQTLLWGVADSIARRLTERLSLQYLLYPSSFQLLRHPWFLDADVIQLYNTHGGFFSHTVLPALSRRRPVVWRLSDMWPMTGHCAYSFDCDRWKIGCGACPLLSDEPALRADRTAFLWRVKRWVYDRSRITLVAPSRWIAGLAAQSPLLSRFVIHWIPNGLDTDVFRPIAKGEARRTLGLDPEERVLMFSALKTDSRRKGGALLQEVLEILGGRDGQRCRLLVVGKGAQRWENAVGFPVTPVDTVKDDRMLAMLYSAADLFVLPTLAENLPNAILESMACGTPVVSCDVGGVPEVVRPMETGYLAIHKDAANLARGIALLMQDASLRERLGRRCREVAEAEYNLDLQARRFGELYQHIVRARRMESSGAEMARQPSGR